MLATLDVDRHRHGDAGGNSLQPIIGGYSPANLVLAGADPNKVFRMQERYKKVNGVNDDGTKRKKAGTGTKIHTDADLHIDNNGNAFAVKDGKIIGNNAAYQLPTATIINPPSFDAFLEHQLNANARKFFDNLKARNKLVSLANKKGVDYSTAALQEKLYRLGYYNNSLSYDNIDGIYGKDTDDAYKKALADGYIFDKDSNELILANEAAIRKHKVDNNVKDRYVVVDKLNYLMKLMQDDKTLNNMK